MFTDDPSGVERLERKLIEIINDKTERHEYEDTLTALVHAFTFQMALACPGCRKNIAERCVPESLKCSLSPISSRQKQARGNTSTCTESQGLLYPAGMKPDRFYNTSAWRRKARPQALHDASWRCQRCNASLLGGDGNVHHRKPYRQAPALRTEPLNLLALCRACHTVVHEDEKKPLMTNIDGTRLIPLIHGSAIDGGVTWDSGALSMAATRTCAAACIQTGKPGTLRRQNLSRNRP